MILAGIIDWHDVLGNRQAWNALTWFATLVTLADGLNQVGLLRWFATGTIGAIAGLPVIVRVILIVLAFFVVHYMFASLTAHTTALLPVFLAVVAASPDLPVRAVSLLLCYTLGLMGVLTPYGTGCAPIYHASGYIGRGDFWRLGAIFGAIYLAVLLALGLPYLAAPTWERTHGRSSASASRTLLGNPVLQQALGSQQLGPSRGAEISPRPVDEEQQRPEPRGDALGADPAGGQAPSDRPRIAREETRRMRPKTGGRRSPV